MEKVALVVKLEKIILTDELVDVKFRYVSWNFPFLVTCFHGWHNSVLLFKIDLIVSKRKERVSIPSTFNVKQLKEHVDNMPWWRLDVPELERVLWIACIFDDICILFIKCLTWSNDNSDELNRYYQRVFHKSSKYTIHGYHNKFHFDVIHGWNFKADNRKS